ncbi:DegT/DnrJ/EryC1/StrS family aminotransferase [Candidatus Pelagibacter sp.]|uniref:DegT/DnrJ/EryC1/StrS family aminotransferase n=1 Tax=Candidatus Pelagibacter sp. TaxID=2024849 RepID=UPI003F83B3DC
MKNFLPTQYKKDNLYKIKHNYLSEQFSDYKSILKKFERIIKNNDFTLGIEVDKFENNIKKLLNQKYVVAVGSGTDALMLSLKCLGIKEGDEVITTPYTFYATIGAIVSAGAKPVFVDVNEDYNINPKLIEKKITKKTKAIMPVHWSGKICEMKNISRISKKYKIPIVEDACHGILASYNNKLAGSFGDFGCFSLHPLKNLNVWGDGGFVVIKKKENFRKMMLLRNHGLKGRNKNLLFGYNSRLDTLQACVANHLLKKIKIITNSRIKNAIKFDKELKKIDGLILKKRSSNFKEVFHLYEFRVKNFRLRNKLLNYLIKHKIDAKIHYPVPMHLQPAAKIYKYKKGDFPNAEKIANSTISLPVHEYLNDNQLKYIVQKLKKFFYES